MSLDFEFAPIDVRIEGHPKAWKAGPEAMGLWLWGMVHARQHKTGGVLDRVAVLGAWGGKRNIMLAKRLVEAGLWLTRDDGAWGIHNFEPKTAGRSKSTERVKRYRERFRNTTETRFSETSASLSSSVSLSSPDLALAPEPVLVVPPKVLGLDGEGGAAWIAWREGIGKVTKQPVSELRSGDKPDLVAFTNAHAGGLRGEPLMAWISKTAEAFARANDPRFGFTTKRCLAWLDGGRPAANRPPGQQEAPKPQDSRKAFKERDAWVEQAGAPDPEAQARLNKLLGKVGT